MKNSIFKNKNILVAGATGTIGIPLVKKLQSLNSNITAVALDDLNNANNLLGKDIKYLKLDLRDYEKCEDATKNQDYVFNLTGIKGNVGIGFSKAASYFVPMILCQTNLMEASFRANVSRYLFVSSICAYPRSEIHHEENMWNGLPLQNDKYPGLVKRIGEIQAETYLHEYDWDAVRIVRPSNVYGPYDDFNSLTAQVIPALIGRVLNNEDPLNVWGDGTARRDFIFSEDLVDGLLLSLEKSPSCFPVNLGSGKAISIKEIVKIICDVTSKSPEIIWDTSRPSGDLIRKLDVSRSENLLNFKPKTSLIDGIKKTVDWYMNNKYLAKNKSDVLSKLNDKRHGDL
mgnify:CR=1 FL=1